MISYELAKRLKDVGFPQGLPNFTDSEGWTHYSPNLSELIEACKTNDGFVLMGPNKNINDVIENKGYGAVIHHGGVLKGWTAFIRNASDDFYVTADTPEEAVANLWLKINQK